MHICNHCQNEMEEPSSKPISADERTACCGECGSNDLWELTCETAGCQEDPAEGYDQCPKCVLEYVINEEPETLGDFMGFAKEHGLSLPGEAA